MFICDIVDELGGNVINNFVIVVKSGSFGELVVDLVFFKVMKIGKKVFLFIFFLFFVNV